MKWETVKFSDFIKVKSGVNLTQENMDSNGIYPVYGGNGVTGKHSNYNVEKPTLVIGRVGYYCGSIHLTEGKSWITDNAFITTFPEEKFNIRYLYYVLRKIDLRKFSNSSAQPVISGHGISKAEIPLPPLPIQQQIADTLDKADALRRKDQELLDKYDELAQAVFYEMFGDVVLNDRNWEVKKFEEIGSLERGVSKHRPRNAPELLGGPYPLIQTGDIARCDGVIRTHNQTYSEIGLKQSKIWSKGTLCITIAANIAKTGILSFDACFPDSVVGFTPSKRVSVNYVRFWLMRLQKILEEAAPESAQKNINLEILRNLQIPVPAIDLQFIFEERQLLITNLKQKTKTISNNSNKLFNTLMSNLIMNN